MANWNTLKTAVADVINANGNQAITGQLLQNVLNNIITNVGENAAFAGIATLDTNPGAPDGPVFYLTATAGTYPNFNGIEVQDGEVVILLWNNNAWSKKVTGFATQEKLSELGSKVGRNSFMIDEYKIAICVNQNVEQQAKAVLYKIDFRKGDNIILTANLNNITGINGVYIQPKEGEPYNIKHDLGTGDSFAYNVQEDAVGLRFYWSKDKAISTGVDYVEVKNNNRFVRMGDFTSLEEKADDIEEAVDNLIEKSNRSEALVVNGINMPIDVVANEEHLKTDSIFSINLLGGDSIILKPSLTHSSEINAIYIQYKDGTISNIFNHLADDGEYDFEVLSEAVGIRYYISKSNAISTGTDYINIKIKNNIIFKADLDKKYSELNNKTSELNNKTSELNIHLSEIAKEDYYAKSVDFYRKYEDGALINSENWDTFYYKTRGYKKIVAFVRSQDNVVASVSFYDSLNPVDKSYIKTYSQQSKGSKYGDYYETEIPDNAVLVGISNLKKAGDYKISLQSELPLLRLQNDNSLCSDVSPNIIYVAHRGVWRNGIAPENSIDSIRLAAIAGFDACEMDVKKTLDGHFVISHSSNMKSECLNSDGTPIEEDVFIENNTLDYLRTNYILKTDNPQMRNPIPTLKEALLACKKFGIVPYIDCKIVDNADSEGDPSVLFNLIRRYYGTDKIYFANSYANKMRDLSQNINCGAVRERVDEPTVEYIKKYIADFGNNDGENLHTNFGGYYSNDEFFTEEDVAKYNEAGITFGVFETGVNANFYNLLKKGVNLLVTDYTAPKIGGRATYYNYNKFEDFKTNGTIVNGYLQLTAGQIIQLTDVLSVMYFAGVYISFEMIGSITFKTKGYTSDAVDYSNIEIDGANKNEVFVFNHMIHNLSPDLIIEARENTIFSRLSFSVVKYMK